MSDEILVSQQQGLGVLSLNREASLNALSHGMCTALLQQLQQWQQQGPELVLLEHLAGRGFCAGGDIRALYDSVQGDGQAADDFFYQEYQLNALLFNYAKPVVALINGITMGGGAGISLPCRYRVATENTRFAMPETGIGLFPDVGGGWYLPRLPHRYGYYIALTGEMIKGADCVHTGLATHYVSSDKLPALKAALAENPANVQAILDEFNQPVEATPLSELAGQISEVFAADSVAGVLDNLQALQNEWGNKLLSVITSKSPLSTLVSMQVLNQGADKADFVAEMHAEYQVVTNMVRQPDFSEGVRALLIDKDKTPKWQHSALAEVSADEVAAIFSPRAGRQWQPL